VNAAMVLKRLSSTRRRFSLKQIACVARGRVRRSMGRVTSPRSILLQHTGAILTQDVSHSLLNSASTLVASDCVDVKVDALSVGLSESCLTIQSHYCTEFTLAC
jgi:hypothetical protein